MTGRWTGRLVTAAFGWLVVTGMIALGGGEPNVALLAIAALAVAVLAGVAQDLTGAAVPVVWEHTPAPSERVAGSDSRTWLLERRIAASRTLDGSVCADLVALADDRLRTRRGIDRATSPDAAREACGPLLWAFLSTDAPVPTARLSALLDAVDAI